VRISQWIAERDRLSFSLATGLWTATLCSTVKREAPRTSDANDAFIDFLSNSREAEAFFHDLIGHLANRRPKPGADVTKYADELRLKTPRVLKGAKITWANGTESATARERAEQTLVLVRPGHVDALGFTIGCIRVRGVKICLECGWLYCRIVIKGRF
jgi:hypothetical protein